MRIIGGIWANAPLISPGGRVRPTHEDVRGPWLDALAERLEGARVLELFAGTGALGLEALSRGAASVDFVENGGEALHALKANIASRKLKRLPRGTRPTKHNKAARIFKRDALPFCARLDAGAYDLAFADPPYGSRKLDRIVSNWLAVPFATLLCVEHAAGYRVPPGVRTLSFDNTRVTFYEAPRRGE